MNDKWPRATPAATCVFEFGRSAEVARRRRELVAHLATERLHDTDHDQRDERKQQDVLNEVGAPLVTSELRGEPGLEDEQIHWEDPLPVLWLCSPPGIARRTLEGSQLLGTD